MMSAYISHDPDFLNVVHVRIQNSIPILNDEPISCATCNLFCSFMLALCQSLKNIS